jgi:hypothetical protein
MRIATQSFTSSMLRSIFCGSGGQHLEGPPQVRLPDARQRGDVQRAYGAEAAGDGLPGAHLLPAAEAYGGRQDPQPGAGASAGKRFLILGELLLEIVFWWKR